MKSSILRFFIPLTLLLLSLTNCLGSSSTDEAAKAIETYFHALVNRDLKGINNITCLAWEDQANREFNSFSAVSSKIEDLDCQVTDTDGDYALVECQGKIITNLGGEDQEFELRENHYQTFFEEGAWRMCGYH